MIVIRLFFCAAAILLAPHVSRSAFAVKPLRIRVLSYNIHHGAGIDGKLDLERIAKIIKSVSPDLVALQEVEKKTKRTNRVDQPATLGKLTGMYAIFERNIPFQDGEYGNAILSKWKIDKHKNHHLPNVDNGEQRGVLVATLKPGKGRPTIRFLCTHFDHRRPDAERLASAKFVNRLRAMHGQTPAILAGDLNATPASRVLKEVTGVWHRANIKIQPTVPVGKPTTQIDYILVSPKFRWKVIEFRVLAEAVASDHRAVFAVLELQSP